MFTTTGVKECNGMMCDVDTLFKNKYLSANMKVDTNANVHVYLVANVIVGFLRIKRVINDVEKTNSFNQVVTKNSGFFFFFLNKLCCYENLQFH